MSVVIRLAKTGKKGTSLYRIVAIEKKRKRDSQPCEILGFYEKRRNHVFRIKETRLAYWRAQGAKLTHAVQTLLAKPSV